MMSETSKEQLAESLKLEATSEGDPDRQRRLSEAADYLSGNDKGDWENAVACLAAMRQELMVSLRELAIEGSTDEYEAAFKLIARISALITGEKAKNTTFWVASLFRH